MRRPETNASRGPGLLDEAVIRLDLLGNPYGSAFTVQEALAGSQDLHLPAGERATALAERLGRHLGLPAAAIVFANGIDALLRDLFGWLADLGPLVIFPPSDQQPERLARRSGLDLTELYRTPRFEVGVDPRAVAELPVSWSGYVQSPNDPSGTILATDDAVRLARGARALVIDERHGAYSPRTLLPLAREFDNVIVLRTFETWAGLAGLPLAYAVVPGRLRASFDASRVGTAPAMGAVIAADATLDDLGSVLGTVRQVRSERSRMYRALRKLNMVSVPYPSWANFLLVRAERTTAPYLVGALERRGVRVAPVEHEALHDSVMRVGAGLPRQTDRLQRALIEIGATL